MCASYGLQITAEDAHYAFGTLDERASTEALREWLEEFRDEPAKPTGVHRRNLNPIVREREREGERRRTLNLAWWKLWVGGKPATFPAINARVEKLLDSGAWASPTRLRRALVPVSEYYEKGRTFRLDDADEATAGPGGLFALAGVWNVAKSAEGEWVVSYAIVTRDAVPAIAGIHDRMPLIVRPELYGEWLDPTRVADRGFLDEVVSASRAPSERLEVE